MTCEQVNEHLDQSPRLGLDALPEAIRHHLLACPRCRTLWELLSKEEETPSASPETQARIQERILDSLRPVSPIPSTPRLVLSFLLIFLVVTAGLVGWIGTQGVVGLAGEQLLGLLAVMGVATVMLAWGLSREMVPGERRLVGPKHLALIIAALFLTVVVLFPWNMSRDVLASGWPCFRAGFLLSVPAAGVIALLLRRGAVLNPGVAGASVGLLAGLVSMTVLHLGCDIYTAPHIALSHLGVAVVGTLAGYLLGRLVPFLAFRSRESARQN